MSRVLVVGQVPLPFENLKKFYAPGARTWHFASPLISDGHEVVIMGIRIPFVYDETLPEIIKREERGCTVYSVSPEVAEGGQLMEELVTEYDPQCIIGVNSYPSYIACISRKDLPIWADINGSLLSEAQLKAAVYEDDTYLDHFYRMDHAVVMRADRFSTVALRQKYELVGELAFARRLTSATAGYDFVVDIPNAVPDTPFEPEGARLLRERTAGDFLALWSGGYNTWTDIDTLFRGLSLAMDKNPRIKYVSTGGAIDGHDELTYPSFTRLVEKSPHRDRFLLEGWIDRDVARSYYLACDVGINIDAATYEVMFGSRNRIMDWAIAGLPAISTDLCELTSEFASRGLLFSFKPGDPESLARLLLEMAGRQEELARTGERLKQYVQERFSYQNTTKALREWVADPSHSPDYEQRRSNFLPPPPPITPESSSWEKFRFYVKNEGLLVMARRSFEHLFRKVRGG